MDEDFSADRCNNGGSNDEQCEKNIEYFCNDCETFSCGSHWRFHPHPECDTQELAKPEDVQDLAYFCQNSIDAVSRQRVLTPNISKTYKNFDPDFDNYGSLCREHLKLFSQAMEEHNRLKISKINEELIKFKNDFENSPLMKKLKDFLYTKFIQDSNNSKNEPAQKKVLELMEANGKLKKMAKLLKEELENRPKKEELENLEASLQEKEEEIQELKTKLKGKKSKLEESEAQIEENEAEMGEKDDLLKEKEESTKELESKFEENKSLLEERETQLKESKAECKGLKSQLEEVKTLLQEVVDKGKDTEIQTQNLKVEIQEMEDKMFKKEKKIKEIEDENELYKGYLSEKDSQIQNLSDEIEEAEEKIEDLMSKPKDPNEIFNLQSKLIQKDRENLKVQMEKEEKIGALEGEIQKLKIQLGIQQNFSSVSNPNPAPSPAPAPVPVQVPQPTTIVPTYHQTSISISPGIPQAAPHPAPAQVIVPTHPVQAPLPAPSQTPPAPTMPSDATVTNLELSSCFLTSEKEKWLKYCGVYLPNLQTISVKTSKSDDKEDISKLNSILINSVPVGVQEVSFKGRFTSENFGNFMAGLKGLEGKIYGKVKFEDYKLKEDEHDEMIRRFQGINLEFKSIKVHCENCNNDKFEYNRRGEKKEGFWCKSRCG